jgi:hypothetical protein
VVINLNFQNLNAANSEILKAFNSETAAKALEAYQPLELKERKRQKLKALQILKQSSNSPTLADINLNTDSLAIALQEAEGPTLQAMLNLLSSKMIEQNKYRVYSEDQQSRLKNSIKEKIESGEQEESEEQESQDQEENPKDRDSQPEDFAILDKLQTQIEAYYKKILDYFQELKDRTIKLYESMLDAVSLEKLKEALEGRLKQVNKYLYELPVEFLTRNLVEPVSEVPTKVREYMDKLIKDALRESQTSFSAEDIRAVLNQALNGELERKSQEDLSSKLSNSVNSLDKSLIEYNKKLRMKEFARSDYNIAKDDIRFALHHR